jgi:subtilisin family serine protease
MSLRLLWRLLGGAIAYFSLIVPAAHSQSIPASSTIPTVVPKYARDRILVKFRHGLTPRAMASVHLAVGTNSLRRFSAVKDLESVSVPKGLDVAVMLRSYRQRPEVEYAEPDFIVHSFSTPNDALFPQMWNLQNTGQIGGTVGSDVDASLAWNLTIGSHNVVVAIIDSGIDYHHPDLVPNLFHDSSACNGASDGTNGCFGISTASYTSDVFDDLGHGTHVAGTIGASGDNGLGVVGINWNVQLLSCKFLGSDGSGLTSDAIACLDYIVQMKNKGYNIVATNNSWGGVEYSQALADAIQEQENSGILFVAASGNEFNDNDVLPTYPASIALPNVISVEATTRNDGLAVFSNTGRHSVHIGAPGQEILSTWPGGTYEVLSGTSMASPHVAGAAALLAAYNSALDWRALKNLILAGGDTNASLNQTVSRRRLNLNGSLTCSGKTLESRLQPRTDVIAASVGEPVTLQAINVTCGQPAGNVQVSVGGSTITLVDDGTSGDEVAGDGVYTAQWTPISAGGYTLMFPGSDIVQAEVLNSYTASPTSYNYVSITGTNLNLADDDIAQITSPFPIPFGGGSFNKLQVGANGTISFTDAYSSTFNRVIPIQTPLPVTLVAPFWQDLYPVRGSAQNVYWSIVGSAPNRQLVVEWRNVRSFVCHSDAAATVTFEVVFSESSSDILFQYADTSFGDYCYFQDAGAFSTVGVQVSPTVGTMWSVNDSVLVSGTALVWKVGSVAPPTNPVPNITSLSPSSAPIGGPAFTLTVNGTGFLPTSSVTFNLFKQPTTYVSSTRLTAEIPAKAIAQSGTSTYVWVNNPAPGGGQSQAVVFPLSSGVPTITSISPSSVTAGSFSFALAINGTGFGATAVYWNGALLANSVLSSTSNQLEVAVPYNLIANPGTAQITLVNSPPGGGTSNAAPLTILPQTQGGVFLQAPSVKSRRKSPPMTMPSPVRFLGWNYAARGGENYKRTFLRQRAQGGPPNSDITKQVTPGSALAAASGNPALVGLQLRPLLPADYIPTAVAAGDVNGDGIPDWIVANGGSNNLWVYLGRGDGTFTQATVIPLTGQSPLALALADLRGSGKLDIVVAEADSSSLGVMLGNGDGTFGLERTFFLPGAPLSLAVADLNHDGHLDVVAGVMPDPGIPSSGSVVSLIGDGAGSFGDPLFQPYTTFGISLPESIVIADFEKNGKPDVAVVDPGVGAVMYINDGTGFLKEAQPIDTVNSLVGIGPIAIASGDVNEDGCPDVITVDNLTIARVFLGNCDSTFQPQLNQIGEGDLAYAITAADVNGDGHLDLVYSGISAYPGIGQIAGNLVGVHFGDGKGNFGPASVFRGGQTSFGLAIADFNRDGHPDIITANQDSDSASMFLNDGKGGFGFPAGEYIGYITGDHSSGPVNAPFTFAEFASSDIDGNGKPDLVIMEFAQGYPNPLQATVMLNDGAGHFGSPIRTSAAEGTFEVTDFLLADFRNTGRPDLVTISSYFGEGANPQLVFAPNIGGGSFGTANITNIPLSGPLVAGDFNHDGYLDLAIASPAISSGTATITIYLGHGNGTFTSQSPITFTTNSAGHWVQGLWVGDFNGDGKIDLLAWFYLNVVPFQNNDVYELLGNGDGTFGPAKVVIQNLTNPAVADLNHDGRPDVVENRNPEALYPDIGGTQFQVYLCKPSGSFALNGTYAPYTGQQNFSINLGTPMGGRSPAWIGDFNGDGNIDLAAIQHAVDSISRSSYVQFLSGNGDGSFTPTYEPYYLNGSQPANAFDLTGDGRADMVENDDFTSSFHVIPGSTGKAFQLALLANPVIGTQGGVQVSLAAISNTATQISLVASDPAITLPASVTIPAGSISKNVNFSIGSAFNSTHVFWIKGTLNSSTSVAYGTQANARGQYGAALFVNGSTQVTFPGLPTADYQLGINSLGGYSTTVTLSCQGLPSGASCQFGSGALPVPPGGSNGTSLIINTSSNTPVGVYPITVVATDGAITSQLKITLDVGDYSVSIAPSSETVLSNTTATYVINVKSINSYSANFTGTCTGIPAPGVCAVTGSGGGGWSVSIQTNTLSLGSYNFTVSLSNGVASRSASAQLNIGDFNASVSANSLTVNVGQSGNLTVDVTGLNGFSDPVSLTCSGAPVGTSCNLNPNTLIPSEGGTPSTLTVQVVSKPALKQSLHRPAPLPLALYLTIPGFFGFVLLVSKRSGNQPRLLLSLTLLVTLGLACSCGGGGTSGSSGSGAGGGGGGGGTGGTSVSFTLTVQAAADGVSKNVGLVQVTVP